jgi:hypothetical protein
MSSWMAAARSSEWALTASSLTSCATWMHHTRPWGLTTHVASLLARYQAPRPLCFLGKSPPVQLLHVHLLHNQGHSRALMLAGWIRASPSPTSRQSAALCTALASRFPVTGLLNKLASSITYTTENQITINQHSNKCRTA